LLGQALAQAAPEGFRRLFLDEGEALRQLVAGLSARLEARVRAGLAPEAERRTLAYARELLAAWEPGRPTAGPTATRRADRPPLAPAVPVPTAPLVEPLSARELDVLRLVAAGLSNQDIAAELVVAQSTIQWHVKNIFGKLQVRSRTQAAVVARQLGLVA
jgi:LuxR family maltose regulon positive regulatory protein